MSYLFLAYPKCNTCRNAKKWLDEHKITYEDRHIIAVSYTHLTLPTT